LITTSLEGSEVQPSPSVTVKLCVPGAKLLTVVLVPDPAIPPGLIVQLPEEGKPFNTTLPVETAHVGCVIVPIVGALGPVQGTVADRDNHADPLGSKVVVPTPLISVISEPLLTSQNLMDTE
jgi:hypothetical protein